MENATDALIMAGSVLIFIIALTITISSFSTVRKGIDGLISQTETVELAEGSQGYVNYMKANGNTTRVVGAETVIASMYRTLKENYVVYIELENYDNLSLTSDKNIKIDTLENESGKILKFTLNENDDILTKSESQKKYQDLMKIFYKKIENMTFDEKLGEYQNKSDVSKENKLTYRIITYSQRQS